jgi:hypothetical protein
MTEPTFVLDGLNRAPRSTDPRNRTFSDKPPQKQCKVKTPHTADLYEGPGGLIWSCQGRGQHG